MKEQFYDYVSWEDVQEAKEESSKRNCSSIRKNPVGLSKCVIEHTLKLTSFDIYEFQLQVYNIIYSSEKIK